MVSGRACEAPGLPVLARAADCTTAGAGQDARRGERLRALLREAGLKLGTPTRKELATRVRELTATDPVLSVRAEPLLTIIAAMIRALAQLTERVLDIVRDEPVCRRPRGVAGAGPLTALACRATSRRSKRRLQPRKGRGRQTSASISQTASAARATWARISA